jgi:hypothetical protein
VPQTIGPILSASFCIHVKDFLCFMSELITVFQKPLDRWTDLFARWTFGSSPFCFVYFSILCFVICVLPHFRVNITLGPNQDQHFTTGQHIVNDIYCICCQEIIGWRYVSYNDIFFQHLIMGAPPYTDYVHAFQQKKSQNKRLYGKLVEHFLFMQLLWREFWILSAHRKHITWLFKPSWNCGV